MKSLCALLLALASFAASPAKADERINSNGKHNNPNLSVLEFLQGRPGFEGRVAAFCTWDVFPFIYLRDLWQTLQEHSDYRDCTTLLLTTDHGRGSTRVDWTDHGEKVPGAEQIWMALLGPDTPPLGVRENVRATQSQVAATIAALLGEDFCAAVPAAAAPLTGVRRIAEELPY